MDDNTIRIYARCSECLEELEVKEIEGSALNSIVVTVIISHDCLVTKKKWAEMKNDRPRKKDNN